MAGGQRSAVDSKDYRILFNHAVGANTPHIVKQHHGISDYRSAKSHSECFISRSDWSVGDVLIQINSLHPDLVHLHLRLYGNA